MNSYTHKKLALQLHRIPVGAIKVRTGKPQSCYHYSAPSLLTKKITPHLHS